jgi:SLT domain-containing protein
MPDEIDRLEIAVETEANNANRALGTMEKKLNRVADSLEKVMLMAQGGFSFKNVDFDKLLSGSAMKNSAKKSGKELSDSLISGFNLDKAGADVQKQVKALTSKISKGLAETSGHPYKGLDKDMKSLGALVSKNGSIAKSTSDDYQRLYETIKAMGRIKIHPATAKSLGDSYKDRSGVLKQKINTSSGTELDSIYQELKGQFPGILKDVNNVEDEFYQLNDAVKKFYETSKGTYKPDWLEDSAYESVADGVSDIVSGIQKAKTESTDLSASMHEIEDTGKSFSELFGAGLNTSGLEKVASLSREITRQRSDSQKKNRTDLKFPALPYSEINEKFANSKSTTDFSSMGISDLRNEVSKNQRAYDRMKQSIADKVTLSGTDEMGGKDWYRSIMQMNQYRNAINDGTEAIKRFEVEKQKADELAKSKITIMRDGDGDAEQYGSNAIDEKVPTVIKESSVNAKNLSDNLKKVSVPKEAIDDAQQLGYRLADTADKMNSASKQSVFHKFPQMMKDSFKMNEDGQLPALQKFSDTFRKSIGSMPTKVMDFMKLDESGSIKGISSLKEKIRDASNTKMKAPDTSAIDEQISKIKREISQLRETMQSEIHLGKFDSAEDTYQDILMATKALKQYEGIKNQAFQSTEKVSAFKRALAGIKGSAKSINSAKKSFNDVSKAIQNARSMARKAIHPFRTLKEIISGANNSGNKGMSWGRMLGSSLMFSTVFGAISQIKEAIKAGSDNLVQYSSAYNKSISGMVTSLLYLKNAWAAAFAPVVNVAAPYISRFIDMIAGALNAVGQFTAALTGKGRVVQAKKAWYNYGKSLEDTGDKIKDTTKKAKDLQNYLLGIDELNVLQPNTDSNSGSGSSGSGGKYTGPSASEMFETIEVPNSMNKLAEMFKDAIAESDFTDIGRMISNKLSNALESIDWKSVYHHADNFGKDLATFLNGLITPRLFYDLGATIAGAINTAFHAANSFAINFDWSNLGASLASSITGFFENWDAGLTGETFSNFFSGIFDAMTSFLEKLSSDDTFKAIGKQLVNLLCGIDWKKCIWNLAAFFSAFNNALLDFPTDFVEGIGEAIVEHITGSKFSEEARKKFEEKFAPIKKAYKFLLEGINPFTRIKRDIEFAVNAFEELKKKFSIGDWYNNNVKPWFTKDKWATVGDGIKSGLGGIGDWMGETFGSARKSVNDNFSDVGTWFGDRNKDIQNAQDGISSWMSTKYKDARKAVNDNFSDAGIWFANRKSDIQNAQSSISTWFGTKYKDARGYVNSAFSNVGTWFGGRKSDIQNNMKSVSGWFKSTFQTAYKGVTDSFGKIGNFFKGIGKEIKKPIIGAMKAILNGVNWVYEKLGGGKNHFNVAQLDKYANGTNGVSHDTVGIVNDQAGSTYREMVQFPNGKTIIPRGRNVMLPMPKGTKVLPADQTASLMNMPHFKKGIGDFFGGAWAKFKDFTGNIADYISNPKKLVQMAIDKFTDFSSYLEPGLSMAKNAVSGTVGIATKFIKNKLKGFGGNGSGVNYKPSAGVEQWRATAKKALELTNQFTEANLNRLLMQMKSESGGNPNAINNWDINAKMGIPSKGLMQVIDPTFKAYAMKGFDKNIYDPMSNILAAIRYTLAQYGSLERGWKGHGYANGGFPKVGEMFYARESGPELVGKIGNRSAVVNNQQIVDSVSNGVSRANDETNSLLRTIIEYQELLLKKETSVNMDGKRMDKQISKARRNTGFSFSPT